MPSPECGLCRGPQRLLHRGSPGVITAADLSPTCHRTGAHGDLYRCERCGTVSQPGVPRGRALLDLYRAMEDGDYLREEAGRRATARRLLDLVERHAGDLRARPRLLDVGCGHGLLLDEARARGWHVLGLEPSAAARAHATRELGLPVRDATLADLAPGTRFDAVVMADVLEHVDDPALELIRCAAALREGGVACVVTPTPARAPRGSPARAGGATCRRTPTCSRAGRCWRRCAARGWTRSRTWPCGAPSRCAPGPAGWASGAARSAARSGWRSGCR